MASIEKTKRFNRQETLKEYVVVFSHLDDPKKLKMVKLFHNSVLVIAFFSAISIDVKLVGSMPHASDDILEINVDGTTGFLRGKKLTTIGKNERPFITFRNIPFALEPERFMVKMTDLFSLNICT